MFPSPYLTITHARTFARAHYEAGHRYWVSRDQRRVVCDCGLTYNGDSYAIEMPR